MDFSILVNEDTSEIKNRFFENGLLKVLPASAYEELTSNQIRLIGTLYGIYSFPTIELAEWLKENCDITKAIEIGAGHGALARYLGIPATDSKMMDRPEIQSYYRMLMQPLTKYPDDIIEMDAIEAIDCYKPETVIGCWVTQKYDDSDPDRGGNMFGIDEELILKKVKKYIVIGNESIHHTKKILNKPHKEYKFPWLFSRAIDHFKDVIYLWG